LVLKEKGDLRSLLGKFYLLVLFEGVVIDWF